MFAEVVMRRDLVYRVATDVRGRDLSLRLDVYAPAGDTARGRPTIVWLHAGGFTSGDKADMAAYARDFAERGYVAVAINYRLRPGLLWFDFAARRNAERDAYEDAAAAIEFLRARAGAYRIDPGLVFAAGYSAGAITAYDLAYPPVGAPNAHLAGSVPISGYPYGTPEPGAPPVLALHGTTDPLVPYAWDAQACSRARRVGDRCDLVTFTAGHDIGTTDVNAIVARTADFLATTITPHR